jgi:ribonuclease P protein component
VLERRHRLTATSEFTSTTRAGRRAGTRTLVVHLAAREPAGSPDSDDVPRIGFAVARSVGNAVARNRVKRRLRHLVRERLLRLPRSVDVVVRALPAAGEASYADLGRDLDKALDKALNRALDRADRRPEPAR